MSLVLDASLTLCWYFEDEWTPAAGNVLDRVAEAGAVVPSIWRLEVANALQVALRRRRFDAGYRDLALARLGRMPIVADPETGLYAWTAILQLADRHELTVYDAAYLELAQRRHLPLGSLDRRLRQAARSLGITLLGLAE